MEELSINYFRKLWQTNVTDLETHCEFWGNVCKNDTVPDDVLGEIRTTIGLAKLLMCQKLKQFKGLIDDSEFKTGEKEITCLDLHGFWDMVYCEVEKIQRSFNNLLKCKNNEWKFVEEPTVKQVKKKIPVHTVPSKKVDSTKSHSLAARQRLAEAKKKMLAQREQQKDQNLIDIVKPAKETVNHMAGNNGETEKNIVISSISESNQEIGEVKASPCIRKEVDTNSDKADFIKESQNLNDLVTNKPVKQKSQISAAQNKENFVPKEDLSNKTQTKSKEKDGIHSKKAKGKSKNYGKLQCVTRSAKKALLTQQNTM